MDTRIAADELWALVHRSELPEEHEGYGKNHLRAMLALLAAAEITGDKAHRWVGWIQGCLCVGKGGTLKEFKDINKRA
jgi:hypothetical protein